MFANGFLIITRNLFRMVAALLPDILFLVGVVSIIWGVHLWSGAGAFIVGGLIGVLLGVVAVRKR